MDLIPVFLGALVIGFGLLFLWKGVGSGASKIKILGSEFSISTPGLVVFLVGCFLASLPWMPWRLPSDTQKQPLQDFENIDYVYSRTIRFPAATEAETVAMFHAVPGQAVELYVRGQAYSLNAKLKIVLNDKLFNDSQKFPISIPFKKVGNEFLLASTGSNLQIIRFIPENLGDQDEAVVEFLIKVKRYGVGT